MPEPVYQADVVIVGAGVAGLAAAHRLTSAGVSTAVLEAAHCVGGRMSTEKVDGFRLDRIGQLLSTSYPQLGLTPGLDTLVLRPFAPGVLVHSEGRHHRASPPPAGGARGGARGALNAVRALASAPHVFHAARRARSGRSARRAVEGDGIPYGRLAARRAAGQCRGPARLAAALARIAATPVERLLARPESPARHALTDRGLPARTSTAFCALCSPPCCATRS